MPGTLSVGRVEAAPEASQVHPRGGAKPLGQGRGSCTSVCSQVHPDALLGTLWPAWMSLKAAQSCDKFNIYASLLCKLQSAVASRAKVLIGSEEWCN